MADEWIFRRRNLPHVDVEGKPTFITACLDGKTPREVISHSIQSDAATQCNRILGSFGSFWQTETFDHFARDEAELMRIIHYIERNPVAAELVASAEDYSWSSARIRKQLDLKPGEAIPKTVG